MKFAVTVILLAIIVGSPSIGQGTQTDFGLPTLHTIKRETLSPSYGCGAEADAANGYQRAALFLSSYSKRRNSPDLLFSGACRSDDEFDVSTAGDDMSLIADLGVNVSIKDVSATDAFNLEHVAREDAYSKFKRVASVRLDHTYVVLINKSDIRGLFIFQVVGHRNNAQVDIKYAVKSYQILKRLDESAGFDWARHNID